MIEYKIKKCRERKGVLERQISLKIGERKRDAKFYHN